MRFKYLVAADKPDDITEEQAVGESIRNAANYFEYVLKNSKGKALSPLFLRDKDIDTINSIADMMSTYAKLYGNDS